MSAPRSHDFPGVIEVIVEIPRGSRNKYEWDRHAGVFRLDRVLSSAVFYNFDYGFAADTLSEDGDPTDTLLLVDEPTFPGCHVWARPVGGLEMRDEKGPDFKVLCVGVGDPHQAHVERLEQIRPHRLVEIENFFQTYKLLEDKLTEVRGWHGVGRAHEILVSDRERWAEEQAAQAPSQRAPSVKDSAEDVGATPRRGRQGRTRRGSRRSA